jgi:hypothetical protein
MENHAMRDVGVRSLDWLVSVQRGDDGSFAPIGSNGFYVRGTPKAAFDQQPVEAYATIAACLEAWRVTGDGHWVERARRGFNWFLGQNQLQQPLYDATTGGCRDGLHPDRVNENQGAESTLSFLLGLLEMRAASRVSATTSRVAPLPPAREEPDPHGGGLALPRSYGLQRRRHAAPGRNDVAPLPGGRSSRALPPLCSQVRERRRPVGDRRAADPPP